MNGTDQFDVGVGPVFLTVFITLWVVALLFNFISSLLLWKEARQKPSWANILLFLIVLLDLLLLFVVLLPAIVSAFYEELLEDYVWLCVIQGCGLNTFVLFTFFLAVCVSVDQYLALCHPFMYSTQILRHQNRSFKILMTVLCIMFSLSFVLSVLPKIVGAGFGPMRPPLLCYYHLYSQLVQNIVFSAVNVSLMIGNSIVLLLCSASVGYQFYRIHETSLAKRSATHVAGLGSRNIDRQQVALAKLSVIIAILFLSCSVPFEVVSILHLLSFHTGHSIDYWVVWLLMVGTVMNPFLYVMVRASVRRTLTSYLKTLLKPFNFCRRRRSNNVAEGRVLHRKDFRQGGNATVTPKSMKRAVPRSGGTVYCANSSSVTHEIPLDVSVEASGNVQLIMIRPLLDEGGSLCNLSTIASEPDEGHIQDLS